MVCKTQNYSLKGLWRSPSSSGNWKPHWVALDPFLSRAPLRGLLGATCYRDCSCIIYPSQQTMQRGLFSPATYMGSLHRFYSLCENTQAVVSDVSVFRLETDVRGEFYTVMSLLEHELPCREWVLAEISKSRTLRQSCILNLTNFSWRSTHNTGLQDLVH